MLNREERRGVVWIVSFAILLMGLLVSFVVLSDPLANPRPAAAKAHRATLRLGALDGRSLDAHDGTPLACAIQVLDLDGASAHWIEEPDFDHPGVFRVAGLPADRDFRFTLTAPGFETLEQTVRVGVGELTSLGDVTLRRILDLNGRVVDGAGERLPGAKVSLIAAGSTAPVRSATTDATGEYLVESLLAGVYRVQVNLDGWAETHPCWLDVREGKHRRVRDLVMTPRLPFTGTVDFVAGTPPSQWVDFAGQSHDWNAASWQGEFHAGNPWCSIPGPRQETTHVDLSRQPRDFQLTLPEPVTVRVELTGRAPGATTWVAARSAEDRSDLRWRSCHGGMAQDSSIELAVRPGEWLDIIAVDDQGRFGRERWRGDDLADPLKLPMERLAATAKVRAGESFGLLPFGNARYAARGKFPKDGVFLLGTMDALVSRHLPGAMSKLDVSAMVAPRTDEQTVRGQVLDPEGNPVADTLVRQVVDTGHGRFVHSQTWSDDSGRFRLASAPESLAPITWFDAPGYAREVSREEDGDLPIQMTPRTRVRFRVLNEDQDPMVGVPVGVKDRGPRATLPLHLGTEPMGVFLRTTGLQGEVVFDLAPGHYESPILRWGPWVISNAQPFTVPQTGSVLEVLNCYRPRTLNGAVVTRDNKPVSGAQVRLDVVERMLEKPFYATTDSNGAFRFEALPPPPWSMRILANGFKVLSAPEVGESETGVDPVFRLVPLPPPPEKNRDP